MKVATLSLTMATAAALTLSAVSFASAQQSNQPGTLMQERQGAIGTDKDTKKPAEQSGKLSGSGAPSAEEEAKAATGAGAQSGGLKFGAEGQAEGQKDNSLPAQRQGTIGTPERPPEPVPQGGGNKQ